MKIFLFLSVFLIVNITYSFGSKKFNNNRSHAKLYITKGSFSDRCSGAIISPDHILTPAHCVKDITSLKVVVYHWNLTQQVFIDRSNIFIHENYDPVKVLNDIAVIKFPGDSNLVNPLELPTFSIVPGEYNKFYGWVKNALNVSELMSADLSTLSLSDCRKAADGVSEQNICTKPSSYQKRVCTAASGSFLIDDRDSKNTLIGLGSRVHKCQEESVAVFINIASNVDWIKEKTGLL